MDHWRTDFNTCYFVELPLEEVNPLRIEQEAWGLLSPLVKTYVDVFGNYIDGYSPFAIEQDVLLGHLGRGWDLLQEWNLISQSYRAKYDQNWDQVEEREQALKELIQRLQQDK